MYDISNCQDLVIDYWLRLWYDSMCKKAQNEFEAEEEELNALLDDSEPEETFTSDQEYHPDLNEIEEIANLPDVYDVSHIANVIDNYNGSGDDEYKADANMDKMEQSSSDSSLLHNSHCYKRRRCFKIPRRSLRLFKKRLKNKSKHRWGSIMKSRHNKFRRYNRSNKY